MSESAALLARLRTHAIKCRDCRPTRARYCWRVQDLAERFAELRTDEVLAARKVPDLRAFLACFHAGHEPGERDEVGRPVACARCGRLAAEMTEPERERFYGRAASLDWDAEATRRAGQRRDGGG